MIYVDRTKNATCETLCGKCKSIESVHAGGGGFLLKEVYFETAMRLEYYPNILRTFLAERPSYTFPLSPSITPIQRPLLACSGNMLFQELLPQPPRLNPRARAVLQRTLHLIKRRFRETVPITIRLLTGRVTPKRSVVYAEPPFADGNVGIFNHTPFGVFVLEVKQYFVVGMRACWGYGKVLIPVSGGLVFFQRSLA